MLTSGRTVLVAVVLGAVAVTLPVLALISEHRAEDRLSRVQDVQRELDLASVEALNAETGLRGYLLSPTPEFLATYDDGAQKFAEVAARMEAALNDGNDDLAVEPLVAAFNRWRTEWAEPRIAQVRAGDLQGAQATTASGDGRTLFTDFRAASREAAFNLAALRADREDARDRADLLSALLMALAVVFSAGAAGVIAWSARSHEVTRRTLHQTRQHLAEEQRLSTRRGELIATASHELRNPLTALVLAAQLLEDEASDRGDEELSEMAEQVTASATRASQMIIELLDYTRVEAGRLAIAREPVSPLDVVEAAIADVRLSHRNVPFDIDDEAPPETTIPGDRSRLRMVVRNLMENALRYGGAPFRVRIRPAGSELEIHVEDGGNGIPREEWDAVFEQFRRGSTSQGPGTGIGLYISRGVVELHGGSLTVNKSKLGGADFVVRLPKPPASGAAGGGGSG